MRYCHIPGVYVIRNTVTGDLYVGSSENIGQRISTHKWYLRKGKHQNPPLQRSWDKYGEEAFSFEVVEYLECKDDLITREQSYIDSLNPTYNILRLAYSPRGYRHTEEAKEKLRQAHRAGRYEGQRAYMRTRPITEAFLEAAKKNVSYVRTEQHRRRQSEVGKSLSEEARRKIGEATRKRRQGAVASPETRAKISAIKKAWHAAKKLEAAQS